LVAKWVWGIGILLAIAYLLWRSRADIAAMLRQLPPWMLVASFLPLFAAKFLLGESARIAANRSGIRISYVDATRLYNLSQLGKYLPGSIWQFVGRAAAYRNQFGASYSQIRDSLLTESLWIVGASLSVGTLLAGVPLWRFLSRNAPFGLLWWFAGLAGVGVATALALFFWRREKLLSYVASAIPTPRVALVQAGIWALLGFSFWILVRACAMEASLLFTIGLFAGGYALGFLVPFAPAGLGIRDAVLTIGLLPYAPPGQALAITVVARLVYLLAELLIVTVQDPFFRFAARFSRKG
jgi:hypothetical protein